MVVLRKHGGDGDGGGDGDDNVDGVQTNWETQFVIVVFCSESLWASVAA